MKRSHSVRSRSHSTAARTGRGQEVRGVDQRAQRVVPVDVVRVVQVLLQPHRRLDPAEQPLLGVQDVGLVQRHAEGVGERRGCGRRASARR